MALIHKFIKDDTRIVLDINSGSVHVVDKLIWDILDIYPQKDWQAVKEVLALEYSIQDIEMAIGEINTLIDLGMLFTEDGYKNSLKKSTYKPVVKALCLHISHDCNIRCKYCFASQGDFNGERLLMPLDIGKKAVDFLIENSGNRRNLEIDFFGGEPLMNFDVVKEIVEYGRKREKEANKLFKFTITTNCLLLDDEKIQYINENMDNLVLSIDGRESVNDNMRYNIDGSGTYHQVVDSINKVINTRKNKDYYVRGTFTSANLDFSKDVLHLADLGFRSLSVEPVVAPADKGYAITKDHVDVIKKEYDILAKEYYQRINTDKEFNFFHFNIDLNQGPCIAKRVVGCGAGAEYVAITPEGDIYPCHQFVGNEQFKMGNINKNEFDFNMQQQFSKADIYNKESCIRCWARFYCSGGCHANAFNTNNDILAVDEISCEMEKARVECAIAIEIKKNQGVE